MTDSKQPSPDNDLWLDQLLAKTPAPYLEDQGFADRVVMKLPRRRRYLRFLVTSASCIIGIALTLLIVRNFSFASVVHNLGFSMLLNPSVLLTAIALLVGFIVFVGTLADET